MKGEWGRGEGKVPPHQEKVPSKSPALFRIKIFKTCVRYFYQIFISDQKKCFLFHLKSFFPFRYIEIFVIPSSPLFPSFNHCFRGWSKINLKAYDVINCLNKNSIIHFVWYLQKEKRYEIKTLSIDVVLNTKHFYEKIMQKTSTKS